MKRFLFSLILLCRPCAAFSETVLKPQDFAYGMEITTDGQAPVYGAEVPLDVYRGVATPDLGDLRVFNADGSVVPHQIASGGPTEEEMTATSPLKVYPLREDADQAPDALSVMVRRGEADAEVNLRTEGGSQPQKKIVAYLLGASEVTGPVRAITLDWSGTAETIVLPVVLEASDDLKTWRTVVGDGVVAQLTVEDQSVRKNRLEFPPVKAAYFRLKFKEGGRGAPEIAVVAVTAEYVTGTKPAEREWLTVKGSPVPNAPRTTLFDLGATLPVDRFEVVLPEDNRVISAEVFFSAKPDGSEPRIQFSGLLYRLKQSGSEVTTGPLRPLSGEAGRRYWFLRLRDDSGGLDGAVPSLKVGWAPKKILFVAQGKGPYLLAYGSGAVRAAKFEVEPLLAIGSSLERGTASLERQKMLGGPERLLPPPPTPPSAREIWGKRLALAGMVLATILLGWMAYRLARQMA